MKTLLIPWYYNYKGGINNLAVMQVRDEKHNVLKVFKSTKGMAVVRKRAESFQKKMANPHSLTNL